MSTQMQIGVTKRFGLVYRDANGNPANAVGSPVWNTGSPTLTLTPSSSGQQCDVTDTAAETTAITVNLGNGIVDDETLEVTPGPAISVEIVALD